MRTTPHAAVEPTGKASAVLFDGEKVFMPVRKDRVPPIEAKRKKKRIPAAEVPADSGLLAALKGVRWAIAQEEEVPAYIVFSNAALQDMAVKRPHTMEEFLRVSGVGEVKATKYGDAFLEAIARYEAENEG